MQYVEIAKGTRVPPLLPGWQEEVGANKVKYQGRTYQVLAQRSHTFSLFERLVRALKGALVAITSVFMTTGGEKARELFWASKVVCIYITPDDVKPVALEMEKQFWQDYFDPHKPALTRCREEWLLKLQEPEVEISYEQAAKDLINTYREYLQGAGQNAAILDEVEVHLQKIIQKNLQYQPAETVKNEVIGEARYREELLPDGSGLRIFATRADGSCGIHALIGTVEGGVYQVTNIADVRREFCSFLREGWNQKDFPKRIRNVLDDYFLRFEAAPAAFQQSVRALHASLWLQYEVLVAQLRDKGNPEERRRDIIAQQEELKDRFFNNDVVKDSYLAHMQNVGTYLLQEELIAVADWRGITLEIAQPGWYGDSSMGIRYDDNINPGHPQTVVVFYNGHNHFERADRVILT